jgi:pyruvate,water dikinase
VRIVEDGIGAIAKVFHPRPVWYRTLDARTDEFRDMAGGEEEPHESNPMLGWHGIRRSISDPTVFRCELQAIKNLRQNGLDNVCIMLPFIISVDELKRAKAMIDFPVKVGIMVETPAAVIEIESFCKEGIAFASIGSNDLTQLMLGVDRNNAKIAGLYTEFHPAVLAAISSVIKSCRSCGVEVSLCGESGSNPKMAEFLVEAGIDSISVEVDAIDAIRQVAARTERKLLLRKARE